MKTLDVNGAPMAVADRGDGPPLVLVHGFPLDHSMWDAQVAGLSRRYRVVAPDLRGFGNTVEASLGQDGVVTMEQFADDLSGLIDAMELGGQVILGGLSMGGYIALAFCRKYAARLRGLILCDTRAEPDTPEAAALRLATADRVLREGAGFLADTMLPKLLASKTLAERPEIVAAARQMMLANDRGGMAAALRGMARRPDSTPLLSTIACPTLVLVGQEDKLSPPEQMEALAGRIPNSRFSVIPHAGHLAPVEQPGAVTAAIEGFFDGIEHWG